MRILICTTIDKRRGNKFTSLLGLLLRLAVGLLFQTRVRCWRAQCCQWECLINQVGTRQYGKLVTTAMCTRSSSYRLDARQRGCKYSTARSEHQTSGNAVSVSALCRLSTCCRCAYHGYTPRRLHALPTYTTASTTHCHCSQRSFTTAIFVQTVRVFKPIPCRTRTKQSSQIDQITQLEIQTDIYNNTSTVWVKKVAP